ncbi:mycofactocin system transcriptional regulator [Nocardia sp. CWNU-33]|uniref:mycofactocin system transcriptional regulator n=1 Tax=Nocardia sp. CWNU-33 TaxID=3392117 RepID=UPI00398F7AF4
MSGNSSATRSEGVRRAGRRPSTSAHELECAAFELFERKGFEATTVDDIADVVGISKRTFFRYFESKNDVVWGNFSEQLHTMRQKFVDCPADLPMMEAIRRVVVDFNRFDVAEVPWHRRRMELILRVPTLQAHSTLQYVEWRAVVAEFAATRLGVARGDLIPQAIGHSALGVAIAAYEHWLAHPDKELTGVLDQGLRSLATGFA